MIELAGGMGYTHPDASLTGPPKNPWDTNRWTGGSSSGSGAAVAAGLVPFAIGSETWGSILLPAASCGLSGLRPTYGRVSRHGAMALCWTLDKLGPLCLTADDCGIVLDAISGPDPKDPTTHAQRFGHDPQYRPGRRYRIGVLKGVLDGAQDAVRHSFEASLASLADVADFEEVEFPDLPYSEVTTTILMVEAASAFEDFVAKGGPQRLAAPGYHSLGPYARPAILATDYVKALRLRGVMARRVDGVMSAYDALAGPTSLSTATPIDRDFRSGSKASAGNRRPDGRGWQRLRPARHIRPQRLRPRRPANRNPVHVASLRREPMHRHRPRIPVPHRLAHQASRRAGWMSSPYHCCLGWR